MQVCSFTHQRSDICFARSLSAQSQGATLSCWGLYLIQGANAGYRPWKISGVIAIYCIRMSCFKVIFRASSTCRRILWGTRKNSMGMLPIKFHIYDLSFHYSAYYTLLI